MTLQASGAISMADIVAEFGGVAPHSLSEYYRGGAYVGSSNMGVPASGAIKLSDFYGASRRADTSYVGAVNLTLNNGAISWPAGTAVGDMAIIGSVCNNTTNSWSNISGWTNDVYDTITAGGPSNNYMRVYSKILEASDLSTPPSWAGGTTGSGIFGVVYRGGTQINMRQNVGSVGGSSVGVTGFSKSVGSSRIMSLFLDRTTSGAIGVAPTGWGLRYLARSSYHTMGVADVDPDTYVDSGSITWTDLQATYTQAMLVYELI